MRGANSLSNAELLAIVLRTGAAGQTVTQMAEMLLQRFKGLDGLDRAPLDELTRIPGVKAAKATQLKAALELGRRLRARQLEPGYQINGPQDVFEALQLEMGALDHEQMRVILLDTKNRIVLVKPLYEGSLNSTSLRTAEIFRDAVRLNCASIIVAHNHPSGDPTPSPEDIRVTEALVKTGQMLDIDVLDHVVIGQTFVSMRQRRLGFAQ